MNVLSVFDGMSCGQIALERAGKKVDNYFASEIDKHAIHVTRKNYPKTAIMGSVNDLFYFGTHFEIKNGDSWLECKVDKPIDLIIGGSPCQDISNLNKFKLGLEGEKSALFYQYWRMWQETKKYNPNVMFLLENVAGNKSAIANITKLMGVKPIRISSNWVSPQNRMRYYWTNIPVNTLPVKNNTTLKNILQDNVDEKYFLTDSRLKWLLGKRGQNSIKNNYTSLDPFLAGCLTKRGEPSWNCNYVTDNGRIRTLTPVEYERLQTVPDNYTNHVEDKYRYEMLGNGWTVDIIAHIFKHIKT